MRSSGRALRWGKPFSAPAGAMDAQLGLDVAAIGGKDSMSGSFLDLDVPPTLISFAIAPAKAGEVLTPEFKGAGHLVYLLPGFPPMGELKTAWDSFHQLCRQGKVKAAWAVEAGGVAEAVMKMSFGNSIGFQADVDAAAPWYGPCSGAIVFELEGEEFLPGMAWRIGTTTQEPVITIGEDTASVAELLERNEGVLEQVYPTRAGKTEKVEAISCGGASPHRLPEPDGPAPGGHPVFPGTNCEYDTAQACLRAGIQPEIVVVRNLSTDLLAQSAQALEEAIRRSQMVVLPGGFSGGDEPDGSGKFIASFLRNPRLTDAIHDLLRDRDGLMLGICNGFQALIKLGLVPYGEIRPMDDQCPHSDLQPDRPAPEPVRHHPGGLGPFPLDAEVPGGRPARHPHLPRRGPLCGLRRDGPPSDPERPGGHPVCGRGGRPLPWTSTSTPTAPSCPSRASSPRTAGCSARWGTRSGTATLWAGTFPEISTSRCSSPARNISSKMSKTLPERSKPSGECFVSRELSARGSI